MVATKIKTTYKPSVFFKRFDFSVNTLTRDNVKVSLFIENQPNIDTLELEQRAIFLAVSDYHNVDVEAEYFYNTKNEESPTKLKNDTVYKLPDEDFQYSIDYRGVKKVPFYKRLEELSKTVNIFDKEDIDTLLELPWEFLLDERPIIQVLNKIKRAYGFTHKYKNKRYDSKEFQEKEWYFIATSRFTPQGKFIEGSQSEYKTSKKDYLINNKDYWYEVRKMFSFATRFYKAEHCGLSAVSDNFNIIIDSAVSQPRIAVFDDISVFNPYFMDSVMKVGGKFKISNIYDISNQNNCNNNIITELDGNYSIFRYENLYAFVKN